MYKCTYLSVLTWVRFLTFQSDTCRHLDWVKKVKESRGSMELNALEQAKTINAKGIYQVGFLKKSAPKV